MSNSVDILNINIFFCWQIISLYVHIKLISLYVHIKLTISIVNTILHKYFYFMLSPKYFVIHIMWFKSTYFNILSTCWQIILHSKYYVILCLSYFSSRNKHTLSKNPKYFVKQCIWVVSTCRQKYHIPKIWKN